MRVKEKRGVYILPNLLTTASLFAGFYAIIASLNRDWNMAVMAILGAALLDFFDGSIARVTKTVTNFGIEYDSLADLIAFGVAPSILVFTYALRSLGRWGWLAAFLFLACGALRLARFNTQVKRVDLRYFIGLPIPAAALMLGLSVINSLESSLSLKITQHLLIVLTYILSFLMVSTFPYQSFKDWEWVKHKPFRTLVLVLLILVIIMSHPFLMLWVILFFYVASGPIFFFIYFFKRKKIRIPKEQKR
jgi:CDP-diacylglycerol--serine O-phosphatidyltransferase